MVGNGRNPLLWLDNWHPLGPLYSKFGARVIYNLGGTLHAKVIANHNWQWPRSRNAGTREIVGHTPASFIPHTSREDTVVWNLTTNGRFTIKSAWDGFRTDHPLVNWAKVIWFKHGVPRWFILQWMAILGRFNTKDRLLKWGMLVDNQVGDEENHDHLFLQSPYLAQV